MNSKGTVLVADDDREIVELIADSLQDEGCQVVKAHSGDEVVRIMDTRRDVDLILLDIMMPGMNGMEVCRTIRSLTSAPILFLSAKDRDMDKVLGFEVGADDYITKPFSIDVLVARVKAHLRRQQRMTPDHEPEWMRFSGLAINKKTFEVFTDDRKIDLSTKEFQVLVYLADHQNQVLSREQIYESIWGEYVYGDLNTVTAHIKNLRKKLDQENEYILTVWGVGYKFIGGIS